MPGAPLILKTRRENQHNRGNRKPRLEYSLVAARHRGVLVPIPSTWANDQAEEGHGAGVPAFRTRPPHLSGIYAETRQLKEQDPDVPVDLEAAAAVQEDSGTYLLIIRLRQPRRFNAGSLGEIRLQTGWYVYVGSGRKNLSARIARHQRERKKLHWHDPLGARRFLDLLLHYRHTVAIERRSREAIYSASLG